MAECHPVGFRWVMKAKERGATIIHVDPRFTRTSAVADIHVPIRAGCDIAFLGGDYPLHPRKRTLLQRVRGQLHQRAGDHQRGFQDTEDATGFSAAGTRRRVNTSPRTGCMKDVDPQSAGGEREAGQLDPKPKQPIQFERTDPTLQHPRCVFQILKRHYARYTPEMVEETCGIPPELFLKVAETLCSNSGRETDRRVLLCGRLDAAHRGRAVHPHGGDHSTAAREYGPSRRRNSGAARACLHSRLDGYSDALQSAARLSSDAEGASTTRISIRGSISTRRLPAGGASFRSMQSRC